MYRTGGPGPIAQDINNINPHFRHRMERSKRFMIINDRMAGRRETYAQMTISYCIIWEKTLSLSNLYNIPQGEPE